MNRIEVNVQTGERKVVPLTQAEIDARIAEKAAIDEERAKRPRSLAERVSEIERVLGIKS